MRLSLGRGGHSPFDLLVGETVSTFLGVSAAGGAQAAPRALPERGLRLVPAALAQILILQEMPPSATTWREPFLAPGLAGEMRF